MSDLPDIGLDLDYEAATTMRREAPRSPLGQVDAESIDWAVVRTLRRDAVAAITERGKYWEEDSHAPLSKVDRRLLGRSVIKAVVRAHIDQQTASGQPLWSVATERAYANAVENAVFGFGRLQPLLDVVSAENIEIHGSEPAYLQFGDGHRERREPVADTDEELIEAIRFLGQSANPPRPFDDAHPMMTLALGNRFRLHAIGFGLVDRPSVTIRQHLLTTVTLKDLTAKGMVSDALASFLAAAVKARMSIVIAGDQGAGKTTLLRALIAAIPASERFGTLETDYELLTHLHPDKPNVVAMQARVGLGEVADGRHLGEYTVADLIPEALRQNLARIIVGEVRGVEAGAMFEAMLAGAGTMCTTHAHSAAGTIDRLASRVAGGGSVPIAEAYAQVAHHIGLIIHVRMIDDTWRGGVRTRYVDEVLQLTGGLEGGRPITHRAYWAESLGRVWSLQPTAELANELAGFQEAGR
jgi:Flp pilus assembly CpaF family ATPase